MEDRRLTVTVKEAAELLGIGRALAYELARQGELPAVRLGSKRLVISRAGIEKLLQDAGQPKSLRYVRSKRAAGLLEGGGSSREQAAAVKIESRDEEEEEEEEEEDNEEREEDGDE